MQPFFGVVFLFVIHVAIFLAPKFFSKPSKSTKELNLDTYLTLTRMKFQKNFIIVVVGYVLSLAMAVDPHNKTVAAMVFDLGLLFVSFNVFFYGGAIYTLNALSDVEEDKKEKPHRPLPSGKISAAHAWCFAATNVAIAVVSAYILHGWQLVRVYGVFLFLNVVYSFALRPLPIFFPLIFITVTSPLRLYMGAMLAGHDVPSAMYGLAYQVYLGLQFTRKIIIQRKQEMSVGWLVAYGVLAVWQLSTLDLTNSTPQIMFAVVFVLASLNYVVFVFVPSLRGFVEAQLQT
jgi:hypothetical protein